MPGQLVTTGVESRLPFYLGGRYGPDVIARGGAREGAAAAAISDSIGILKLASEAKYKEQDKFGPQCWTMCLDESEFVELKAPS